MSTFEGFPDGELRYISVPDLFFTGLVPGVDSLSELKVLLHMIWLRQRRTEQAVTYGQLVADETLMQGLAGLGGDPEALLQDGLAQAAARGALLQLTLETESGPQQVFALNSQGGRQAVADIESGQIGIRAVVAADRPTLEPRANIFELYENNIGLLSPILADELRDAEASYPAEWIEEAFHIAAANNVRKWRYIQAILERWATKGKDDGPNRQNTGEKQRWFTDEEFEQFFEH